MKISQKGLYALEALIFLARRYEKGAIKIREIAATENLPEKFLELILLELKHARIVESARGAKGGYRLKRAPAKIFLGEIIRTRRVCAATSNRTRNTARSFAYYCRSAMPLPAFWIIHLWRTSATTSDDGNVLEREFGL
jgi:Rrf2 family protein